MSSIIAEAKVGMLGHSGSGKTCFMYGMYNAFSDFSKRLMFTLFNQDDRDDDDFRDVWEGIEEQQYPIGNDTTPITYHFELRDGLKPLINISWIDYRGQALRSNAMPEEKEALQEQVLGSDCLFLCVESKTLQSDSAKDRNKIARLGALTKDLPNVPLVILMTKADEFESPNRNGSPGPARSRAEARGQASNGSPLPLPPTDPAIEELVRAKFHPWFEQDRAIMISPVSILKESHYYDYLPAPFVFTAYKIVQRKHAEMSDLLRLDDLQLEKRTAHIRKLLGKRTTEELREKINQSRQSLAEFEKKMESLEGYFSQASIYQNRERVDLSGKARQGRR